MMCNWKMVVAGLVVMSAAAVSLHAQVGKSLGVVDVNTVAEKELAAFPNMTPPIAKALIAKRPFMSITDLNTFLLGQGLTQAQADELYGKSFVPINLNTASKEEILLVPGAGNRMAREFPEYRPWKSYAQFDKEIGKYVGAEATSKLAQYTFIPINANTASDEILMTIPGASAALVARLKAGRPYTTVSAVEAAVATRSTPAEGKRVARYVVVQP